MPLKPLNLKERLKNIRENPIKAYAAAIGRFQQRWPAAEPFILKSPIWSAYYAINVINGRWPEAEKVIIKEPASAALYAKYVLKKRWPEAEPVIKTNPDIEKDYNNFLFLNNLLFFKKPMGR